MHGADGGETPQVNDLPIGHFLPDLSLSYFSALLGPAASITSLHGCIFPSANKVVGAEPSLSFPSALGGALSVEIDTDALAGVHLRARYPFAGQGVDSAAGSVEVTGTGSGRVTCYLPIHLPHSMEAPSIRLLLQLIICVDEVSLNSSGVPDLEHGAVGIPKDWA